MNGKNQTGYFRSELSSLPILSNSSPVLESRHLSCNRKHSPLFLFLSYPPVHIKKINRIKRAVFERSPGKNVLPLLINPSCTEFTSLSSFLALFCRSIDLNWVYFTGIRRRSYRFENLLPPSRYLLHRRSTAVCSYVPVPRKSTVCRSVPSSLLGRHGGRLAGASYRVARRPRFRDRSESLHKSR